MKTIFYPFLLCVFLISGSFSAAFSQTADSWHLTESRRKGQITVYFYRQSLPFIYYDKENKLTGIEHGIMEQFAVFLREKTGIKLTVNFIELNTFGKVYQTVQASESGVFGAASFSITEERKRQVDFTPPFMSDVEILISSPDIPPVSDTAGFQKEFAGALGLYVPHSTSDFRMKTVSGLIPGLKTESSEDFDAIRDRVSEGPATFTFVALDNYMLMLNDGRKVSRHDIFKFANEGHGILMAPGSDWSEPINDFFSDEKFPEIVKELIQKHLNTESQELLIGEKAAGELELSLLRKERIIDKLEADAHKLELDNTRIFRNSLIIIVLSLGVTAFVFYRRIVDRNFTNRVLTMKNEQISKQKQEIEWQAKYVEQQKQEVVAKHSELENALSVMNEQQRKITDSIRYAKDIQQAILPLEERLSSVFPEHFIYYKAKDIVSGDLYWFSKFREISPYLGETPAEPVPKSETFKSVFAAIDCTGHGVPGAFMSMIAGSLLNQIVRELHVSKPDLILNTLHVGVRQALRQKHRKNTDGMEVGICTFDHSETKESGFVNVEFAGAQRPLCYFSEGKFAEIKGGKKAVGGRQKEEVRLFESTKLRLPVGSFLYLFSDGFRDQIGGPEGERFMRRRFYNLLESLAGLPAEQQYTKLDESINAWMGENGRQTDDMMVIGLKI